MTHVMDQPDIIAEIGKFRKQMKGAFTCFDPADLEVAAEENEEGEAGELDGADGGKGETLEEAGLA